MTSFSLDDPEKNREPFFIHPKKMLKTNVKPAGNTLSLRCKAGGYPTPNITWYKNGKIPNRPLGEIRYNPWSLTLEDLVTTDSGEYRCDVCNFLGCINFTFSVEVVGKFTLGILKLTNKGFLNGNIYIQFILIL